MKQKVNQGSGEALRFGLSNLANLSSFQGLNKLSVPKPPIPRLKAASGLSYVLILQSVEEGYRRFSVIGHSEKSADCSAR